MRERSVVQVAVVLGQRGRAPHYQWLWDNYDQLRVAKRGRWNWVGACAMLAKLGLTAKDGKPLSPDVLRRTFQRVAADKAKAEIIEAGQARVSVLDDFSTAEITPAKKEPMSDVQHNRSAGGSFQWDPTEGDNAFFWNTDRKNK